MNQAACPTCDAPIALPAGVFVHERIRSADSGTNIEVVTTILASVDLAPEVEEDWGE